jgi:glycosyltransferase involved in cell wall biosynthesis
MNICIESQFLNHHERGGLLTYTEGLVKGMARHDKENDYNLIYYSLRRSSQFMPGPSDGRFKKSVLRVPDRTFRGKEWVIDQMFLPRLPRFFKKNKVKVFHRPAGYTMPDAPGVFKVLTVHDLRTLAIGDGFAKQNVFDYKKAILKSDVCVVVSECTKKDLIEHLDIDEKKIKVVYLGADERYRKIPAEDVAKVRAKYNLHKPFLLSVGFVRRKNIPRTIQAFAASKAKDKYQLVLCCYNKTEEYQQIAKESGVGDQVHVLKGVEDHEVVALYNGCHSFVFASLYEGFGLPILEAFQCGAPVITSNLSSCPEVAGDAAILVDPYKTEEITAAIDEVCSNDGLRHSLIEKGVQRAKLFSWNNFAEEMKKIYSMA